MSEVTSSAPVGAAPEGQSQESPEAHGDQKINRGAASIDEKEISAQGRRRGH